MSDLAEYAEERLRLAAQRHHAFPGLGLTEPNWLILLDLFAQGQRGRRVSVTSACIASRASEATALRHLRTLTDMGYVRRVSDLHDRRRSWVSLDEGVAERIASLLSAELEAARTKRDAPGLFKSTPKIGRE